MNNSILNIIGCDSEHMDEESFYAMVKLIVKESTKKRIRLLVKELMALECIDEEAGEDIIRATFCFKSIK